MRALSIVAIGAVAAFFGATSAMAQSALDRVLTLIDENPELAGETIFMNLASHGANGPQIVDSSVRLVHKHDETNDLPPVPLDLQIDTLAIGATNTGAIQLIAPALPTTEGTAPMFIAVNAATTQSPILAPIDVLSTAPASEASRLSTVAMGSVNTGDVRIVIKPGRIE